MAMGKRNALGRGLGALIDDAEKMQQGAAGISEVELDKIEANPFQPRTKFDAEALEETGCLHSRNRVNTAYTLGKTGKTNTKSLPSNAVSGLHNWPG
jgi:ParB family chromosome partitioning protein